MLLYGITIRVLYGLKINVEWIKQKLLVLLQM